LITQKNKVASLNIEDYFQKVYFTDYWGHEYWKPNTFVFEKIQNEFYEHANNLIYISDNPSKDFIAPNKLGWDSILINRDTGIYSKVETPINGMPQKIIGSLFELKDILKL
jgi:putative hydrolase of the HAD superfamily